MLLILAKFCCFCFKIVLFNALNFFCIKCVQLILQPFCIITLVFTTNYVLLFCLTLVSIYLKAFFCIIYVCVLLLHKSNLFAIYIFSHKNTVLNHYIYYINTTQFILLLLNRPSNRYIYIYCNHSIQPNYTSKYYILYYTSAITAFNGYYCNNCRCCTSAYKKYSGNDLNSRTAHYN